MVETATAERDVSTPLTFADFLWLHQTRDANPLFHYQSPWRRGTFTRVIFLAFVLVHVALGLAAVFGSKLVQDTIIIALIPLALVTGPICFLAFASRRTGHELMELYLTRLTRSEVVYGSVIWGLRCGILAVLAQTSMLVWIAVDNMVGNAGVFAADDLLVMLLLIILFSGIGCLLVVKTMRVWLATPRIGWLVVFTAPLAGLFDFVVLIGVMVFSGMLATALIRGQAGELAIVLVIFSTLIALVLLLRYNIAMSLRWASALFYAEYDGVSIRRLIMGRFSRPKAEGSP